MITEHTALVLMTGIFLSACISFGAEAMRNRNDPKLWQLTCMLSSMGAGAVYATELGELREREKIKAKESPETP